MAQTVVGIFDNATEAQDAVEKLVNKGFNRGDIDMSAQSDNKYTSGTDHSGTTDYSTNAGSTSDRSRNTSGTWGEEVADNTRDAGSGIGDFFRSLFGGSDDNDDYKKYNEVGSRGCVVAVHVSSADEAEQAADILDDCGAVNVDERASQYQSGSSMSGSGMTAGTSGGMTAGTGSGFAGDSGATTGSGFTGDTGMMADSGMTTNSFADNDVPNRDYNRTTMDTDNTDRSIPIIEEQMNVGKREVETGGARLRSRIVERPVEESLRLRTERVNVERNPVNRPVSEGELNAFKEEEIELTERAEVPVVNKEARVVEEVQLTKEVEEREETVRDTVRKTEVDVNQMPSNQNRQSDDSYRSGDINRSGDSYNTGTTDDTFRKDDPYRDDTTRRTDNF